MDMKKKILPLLTIGALVLLAACNRKSTPPPAQEEIIVEDTIPQNLVYGLPADSFDIQEFTIKRGDNPASIFTSLGVDLALANTLCDRSGGLLEPNKLNIGMPYTAFHAQDSAARLQYVVFGKTPTDFVVVDLKDSVSIYPFNKEITLKQRSISGTITSSLWNSIRQSGADPLLAIKLSDIFAWQIDFCDIKEGDSFKAIYNEAFVDDSIPLRIASIEGVEFLHNGKAYHAIPFAQDSVIEYYDLEGNSLQKEFLKSPLDFFRITSRFTNARKHPILKIYRPHHGIDYAAPVGTPVKTIGSGTVIKKAYQAGGGGNYLVIRHNSSYTTTYMHLSKFAKGIEVGSKVQQGQVVAYVGSTGLSSGPHLDFRVHKNGTPINPLSMEAPPSKPIRGELTDSFSVVKERVIDLLIAAQDSTAPASPVTPQSNEQLATR